MALLCKRRCVVTEVILKASVMALFIRKLLKLTAFLSIFLLVVREPSGLAGTKSSVAHGIIYELVGAHSRVPHSIPSSTIHQLGCERNAAPSRTRQHFFNIQVEDTCFWKQTRFSPNLKFNHFFHRIQNQNQNWFSENVTNCVPFHMTSYSW